MNQRLPAYGYCLLRISAHQGPTGPAGKAKVTNTCDHLPRHPTAPRPTHCAVVRASDPNRPQAGGHGEAGGMVSAVTNAHGRTRSRQYRYREAADRSWLSFGFELAEALGGLGEGVGEGLVPAHVRAAGAQFPGALIAQRLLHDRADRLDKGRRLAYVGFGGTLGDRGSLRPGSDERARDHIEDQAHP